MRVFSQRVCQVGLGFFIALGNTWVQRKVVLCFYVPNSVEKAALKRCSTSVPFDRLPGKPGQAGKLPPDPMKNCL